MQKRTALHALAALAAASTLPLAALAAERSVTIGVTAGPHAQIAEVAKRVAEKAGLKVRLVEFSDFVQPNAALSQGEIDANDPDQLHRAELFGADILETSVAMGGTVTGEHGVGVEKLNSMCVQFSAEENEQMLGVKRAFDPAGLLNPGKVIPTLARCAEYGKMLVRGGALPHPELERF